MISFIIKSLFLVAFITIYRCYYKVNLIRKFIYHFIQSPSYKDSNMAIIKKSLLFTVHIVDNKITCVRCNLTGKFIKHGVYFAIENETTTEYGSMTDFNVVSLFDDYINVLDVLFLALFSVLSVSLINLFL